MNKIGRTALTCKICGFVTEKADADDVATITCMACSTTGEYVIRSIPERKSKIQHAERKLRCLNKAMNYINRERNLWEKRLKFYQSHEYDNLLMLEADAEEASDRELASILEKIDAL
jgi:hypothetical protein